MEQLEQLATKRLGRTFLYFDSIHSTNTYLKEQGAQLPDGTAVVAGHQYAGRGRQGKAWQSSEEALALSVLLKGVPPYLMQMLPILFGIGARRALSLLCGREILLKWPNDLLLGEKKIAGILCESAGFGEDALAVCGIGVNLLQEPSFFAELPYGSSLWVECGVRVSPAVAGGGHPHRFRTGAGRVCGRWLFPSAGGVRRLLHQLGPGGPGGHPGGGTDRLCLWHWGGWLSPGQSPGGRAGNPLRRGFGAGGIRVCLTGLS